jgi:Rad3-related DNA helicase
LLADCSGKDQMNIDYRFEVLREAYSDKTELDKVLTKLLDNALRQSRLELERIERELDDFETRYQMESSSFYTRFEEGQLGDAMDYFEWASLYELEQTLKKKIERLISAL